MCHQTHRNLTLRSVDEFLKSESGKLFMPGDVTKEFTGRLQDHARMLFGNVREVLKKNKDE